ncbi:hypothetical protein ACFYZ3_29925 [Streptomyces sp. NPDC001599]|uniref:hypothetical protein n=1 Tax=Streptomyces sp. NPDC001599 TaxID=3364591 RepID=UPI0036BDD8C8
MRSEDSAVADAVSLACFPHSGGSARVWEARIGDTNALADTLTLEPRPLTGPLELSGHSVGAVAVAEMKLLGGTNSRLPAGPEILDMVLPHVIGSRSPSGPGPTTRTHSRAATSSWRPSPAAC